MTSWPGYGVPAYGHAAMLASDADRDRAAEVLKSGFATGRLTKDEYDGCLHRVYTARTNGDLVHVTGQLPGGGMALFAAPAPARTNPLAVASLICGIAEFVTLGLTALPAVVLGYAARGQIRRTGDTGSGLAMAGLILGWLAIVLWVLVIVGMGFAATRFAHVTQVHQFPGPAAPPGPG